MLALYVRNFVLVDSLVVCWWRNYSDQLTKLSSDHDKLESEISQAGLKYTEVNQAMETIEGQLKQAKVQ